MAKKDIKNIEARMKQKQKLRRKRNVKSFIVNKFTTISLLTNVLMGLYIYDPEIYTKLTNDIKNIYLEIAPMVESLINQLPL